MSTTPKQFGQTVGDSKANAADNEYVLGTGADELARLGLQHRLWADAAHAAWKIGRIGPGARVLDVGCGPGYAAFDLASLVGPQGEVVGVDESSRFVGWMNHQAAVRGLGQVRAVVGDVHGLGALLPGRAATFDAAYARWVLCFVSRPAEVLRGVADLLKPGGRLIVHDYFNYTAMTMAPRCRSHDRAVAATAASWRERGGDPDIVGRLGRLLAECGMSIDHLHVHQRVARGHPDPSRRDPMFAWPDTWWRTYAPKLVEMGKLSRADCDELIADLERIGSSTTDFVMVPPVFEVVAVKA